MKDSFKVLVRGGDIKLCLLLLKNTFQLKYQAARNILIKELKEYHFNTTITQELDIYIIYCGEVVFKWILRSSYIVFIIQLNNITKLSVPIKTSMNFDDLYNTIIEEHIKDLWYSL